MNICGSHAMDIFFIMLGCYFVIRGCFRGFAAEMLSLGGFVCTVYLSFRFSGIIGSTIAETAHINIYVARLLAIVSVWFLMILAVGALAWMVRGAITAAKLNGVDRLLGIFSGIVKITVFVYVVLICGLILSPVIEPAWMTESDTLKYAGRHWPLVRQMLIDFKVLPHARDLPDGTLEEILRPYRTGNGSPKVYVPGGKGWASETAFSKAPDTYVR